MKLAKEKAFPVIMNALKEDVGSGDITTSVVFEKDVNITAEIVAKEECVIAGIDVARWIFDALDERIIFRPLCKDGDGVRKGKRVISLKGSVRSILAGERTVLNFIGRLSGVSTLTSRFVDRARKGNARIFDTRKTTPGLRVLEKYAVVIGGGCNHRMGLWDEILIKDNHLDALRVSSRGLRSNAVRDGVRTAKARGYKNIEIEVNNLKEYSEALDAEPDIIMLDNMKIEDIKKAVRLRRSRSSRKSRTASSELRPALEVSGGVNLGNVARISKTGIDRISIGSLTHSAPSVDFSLGICK
ncbi:carboxylating nicotinate-nucleotide diphosphorylase [Candidatus Omnitrophota bacterium]